MSQNTPQEHTGKIIAEKDGYNILRCDSCGFAHIHPVPDKAQLDAYYADKFYEQDRKVDYFALQQRDMEWWQGVFTNRLDLFEQALGRKGRILDVGCGPGFFLAHAKKNGWKTIGIEPSHKAATFARDEQGVEVLETAFEDTEASDLGPIDVIYSHGVMEHMRLPHDYMTQAIETLNPGGLIFSSVANDFNAFQEAALKTLDIEPYWLVPPEHVNYIDVEGMKGLYKTYDLEIISCTTSFPIDMFLLMGDDYVSNPELGKQAHGRRKNFEASLKAAGREDLLDAINLAFAGLGLGRQTDILGRLGRKA